MIQAENRDRTGHVHLMATVKGVSLWAEGTFSLITDARTVQSWSGKIELVEAEEGDSQ